MQPFQITIFQPPPKEKKSGRDYPAPCARCAKWSLLEKVSRRKRVCNKCVTAEEVRCRGCRSDGTGKLCRQCLYDRQRRYELRPAFIDTNPCGGVNLYKVEPPTVRMHHIIYCEGLLDVGDDERTKPITWPLHSWSNLKEDAAGWISPGLVSFLNAHDIERGLRYDIEGNGTRALALTKKGELLYAHGVWG